MNSIVSNTTEIPVRYAYKVLGSSREENHKIGIWNRVRIRTNASGIVGANATMHHRVRVHERFDVVGRGSTATVESSVGDLLDSRDIRFPNVPVVFAVPVHVQQGVPTLARLALVGVANARSVKTITRADGTRHNRFVVFTVQLDRKPRYL